MSPNLNNELSTMNFEKKVEAELLLLQQRKNLKKSYYSTSALTDSIANVNFDEPPPPPTKPLSTKRQLDLLQGIKQSIRFILSKLLRVPLIGPCLRKVKIHIYDPWKNRQIKHEIQ